MVDDSVMVDDSGARRSHRGVALLSVMILLTVGVLLVAGLNQRLYRQVRFSAALQNQEQLYWYSLSAEELAKQILLQGFQDDPDTVHLAQVWALEERTFPMDKGQITLSIRDRQSCFNLNSLARPNIQQNSQTVEPQSVIVFKALLENLEIEPLLVQQVVEASRDWVYADTRQQSYEGAGDDDYRALPVPYLPGDTPMRDESEWRAVLGVTAGMADKAMPYLCTLPDVLLQLNINTLSDKQPELLAALLGNKISVDQAATLLTNRPREGWDSVEDFLKEIPNALNLSQEELVLLNTDSRYFETQALIRVQNHSEWFESLMVRSSAQNLTTIRRRVGGL